LRKLKQLTKLLIDGYKVLLLTYVKSNYQPDGMNYMYL
jgi:hypothetical protein